MNRFGIRLAAGLAVVCLGCLAIFQAQQDKNEQLTDAWPSPAGVASAEPPAPLGISSDWPALPDESDQTVIRGNGFTSDEAFDMPAAEQANSQFQSSYPAQNSSQNGGAVRLASFDQPADQEAYSGNEDANSDYEQPSFTPPPIEMPSPLTSPGQSQFNAQPQFDNQPQLDNSLQLGAEIPADDQPEASAYAPAFNSPALSAPAFNPPANSPATAPGNAPVNAMRLSPLSVPEDPSTDQPEPADDPLESAAANWQEPAQQPATLAPLPTIQPATDQPATDQPAATETAPLTPLPSDTTQFGSSGAIGSGLAQPSTQPSTLTPLDQPQQPAARVASRSEQLPPLGSSAYSLEAPPASSPYQANPGYSPVLSQMQTIDKTEILAEPGTRDLEGAQTPSVLVQKRAPAEIRVGKPAQFVIAVKNVGTVPALDVRVFDTVPAGTSLESTLPPAEQVTDLLVWQLGDLGPGEERNLTMTLVPEAEGEVGSVARVTFETAASVRTVATQPNVQFVHRAPEQVLIGQQMEIDVEIKNTGTGTADNVVVLAELPEGLESTAGRSLKLSVGAMPPGATHRDVLRLRATKPGTLAGQFQILDSDEVINDVAMNVQVISPKLEVALQGPSMRYLERQATYNVQIANVGTADASDIDLMVYLDRGLKFVSTEYQGKYDPTRHAVFWALEELRANEVGEVPLTLLPVEAGSQKVRVETTGSLGVSARSERELNIETLAELSFSIADDQDPIEPGAFTTYEVKVKNTGSRDDTNVVLEVQIPHPGLELVTAEPSAGTDGQGKVIFEPIARIPAKGEQIYRIRVRGKLPDTHIMRATLVSSQSKRPVTKEESTTVYQDR